LYFFNFSLVIAQALTPWTQAPALQDGGIPCTVVPVCGDATLLQEFSPQILGKPWWRYIWDVFKTPNIIILIFWIPASFGTIIHSSCHSFLWHFLNRRGFRRELFAPVGETETDLAGGNFDSVPNA
jgi:hypothetical protein